MADPLIPPEQAEAVLPRMEAAGLGWLTPILRSMIGGDPWQEGQFAVEITKAWERAHDEACARCGAPGVVHHAPGDRPDFWLCWDCDD